MKTTTAFFLVAPVTFGALAHFLRESDAVPVLAGLWVLFSIAVLLWALFISRKHRGLAWSCLVICFVQFTFFSLLFVLIDSRAKTRSAVAGSQYLSCANEPR